MSMRDVEEPTTDERGNQHHPSWVTIGAFRGSGGPGVLFDSDIQHQHTIRVRITTASRQRDLKHDWIHGDIREIIEVEMSEAQWGAFISTPNSGTGTPATLRSLHGELIPSEPYDPRLALNMSEAREAAAEAFQGIQESFETLEALIANGAPKRGPAGINEAVRTLKYKIANAVPNVDYAGKKLIEHTEEVINGAKADIEAFVINKARQLGIDPEELGGGGMLAIEPSPYMGVEDITDAEVVE